MSEVLILASELSTMMKSDPVIVIDTRNPDAYAAGHIPGAVNLHDIFTYLATSTPDGIAELKSKFAEAFGAAGLSGKETAVFYEQSTNSGFGLDPAAMTQVASSSQTLEAAQKHTNDAIVLGLFGSPTYLLGDQIFFGQDRLDFLEEEIVRSKSGMVLAS